MGMAASQARFLGLTARKSNVEYQAQQINQQRTALSNESANLYNQMMTLDVPTPPTTSDFYTTEYVLEDVISGDDATYTISGSPIKNSDGSYQVAINVNKTKAIGAYTTLQFTNLAKREETQSGTTYTISTMTLGGADVKYYPSGYGSETKTDASTGITTTTDALTPYYTKTDASGNKSYEIKDIEKNQIYKVDSNISKSISGYEYALKALKEATGDDTLGQETNELYFYQDASGKNCFMTTAQLAKMVEDTAGSKQEVAQIGYQKNDTSETTYNVQASITKSSTGRISNIQIADNDTYPAELKGASYSVSCKQVYDQQGYDDAYNDYKYQKDLYEKSVDEINSQTAVLQKQDQNLELRIDQLDTEQNAIKTEIDSVKKIIDDNVEKTFNIFA